MTEGSSAYSVWELVSARCQVVDRWLSQDRRHHLPRPDSAAASSFFHWTLNSLWVMTSSLLSWRLTVNGQGSSVSLTASVILHSRTPSSFLMMTNDLQTCLNRFMYFLSRSLIVFVRENLHTSYVGDAQESNFPKYIYVCTHDNVRNKLYF